MKRKAEKNRIDPRGRTKFSTFLALMIYMRDTEHKLLIAGRRRSHFDTANWSNQCILWASCLDLNSSLEESNFALLTGKRGTFSHGRLKFNKGKVTIPIYPSTVSSQGLLAGAFSASFFRLRCFGTGNQYLLN